MQDGGSDQDLEDTRDETRGSLGEGRESTGGDTTGEHHAGADDSPRADSAAGPEADAGREADSEPELNFGSEPDPEPEPESEPEPEPTPEPEPEPAGRHGGAYDEPVIDYGSLSGDDPSGEASFGTWLRRQREMREIELQDIASQTKISLRYLKAMEQDRFDVLPAAVFARGFLKEYSRYVGLNADEVVNYYLAAHHGGEVGGDGVDDEPISMSTESRGPVSKTFLIALVLALLVAVVVYFYFYQRSNESHEEAQPPPIAAPASPLEDLPPEPEQDQPADAQAAPLVVTLDFTQECWLEAQVDRAQRTSRLFVAGESLQLEAQEIVVLENVGNVDGVQVQVNGEPFELPSTGSGATARDVIIDRDSFGSGGNVASGGP